MIKAMQNNMDGAVTTSTYTTWGFSLSSFIASLAQMDWAAIIMGCLGFISLVVNLTLMVLRYKKESVEHEARMILLNRQIAETMIAEDDNEKADIYIKADWPWGRCFVGCGVGCSSVGRRWLCEPS